jgi:hypothetical protein
MFRNPHALGVAIHPATSGGENVQGRTPLHLHSDLPQDL